MALGARLPGNAVHGAFMGLQSLGYYVALTWLPEILQEEVRMSATWAGWMPVAEMMEALGESPENLCR